MDMDAKASLRQQLQTLSIPTEQRPRGGAAGGARRGSLLGRLVRGVLLIAAGAAGCWAWFEYGAALLRSYGIDAPGAPQGAVSVRVMTVTASTADAPAGPVLTGTGKIVSDHLVQVATKVSGQIVALHFEQGDQVEQGQVLAQIEDVNYRALRDERAAELRSADAQLAYEQVNHQRVKGLFEAKRASEIELADAQRALDWAAAQVEARRAALAFAQKTLDDTRVVAPISGVVLERNVEVGDFVAAEGGLGANANAQFGTIADMRRLRVEVDISELDVARVRKGMRCVVTPDAYKDRRYDGEVLWIDPGANYAKATVQAKVRIHEPDWRLRIEGSAQVQFLAEQPASGDAADSAGGPWIPAAAVVMDESGRRGRVFVAEGGRLRLREISVAERRGDRVRVAGGLSAGESIAAERAAELRDGQRLVR